MPYVPGDNSYRDKESAQDKLAVVTEAAALNALELSKYYREKGLYAELVASRHKDASGIHFAG